MKDRLFVKGLITTIIGLSIIIFSGLMIWSGKSSIEGTSGWIALGLLFLRSKDTLINIGDDK